MQTQLLGSFGQGVAFCLHHIFFGTIQASGRITRSDDRVVLQTRVRFFGALACFANSRSDQEIPFSLRCVIDRRVYYLIILAGSVRPQVGAQGFWLVGLDHVDAVGDQPAPKRIGIAQGIGIGQAGGVVIR